MPDKITNKTPDKRAEIPQVDRLLNHEKLQSLATEISQAALAHLIREELKELRENLLEDGARKTDKSAGADEESDNKTISGKKDFQIDADQIAQNVLNRAHQLLLPGIRKVINGTGVILNTNLGRAPLPFEIGKRIEKIAGGYTNLELDLETGKRGERGTKLEQLCRVLLNCQKAIVVNNNASSVMLAVAALSSGKEVIVSRGELIEIGGSFRLPDVIQSAGGILKEVGTTNRTSAADYKKAITEKTGMILKCHRSNFAITGFTQEASVKELVDLGRQTGIPVLEDLGSGALVSLHSIGLDDEPTVPDRIAIGLDACMFSCDKILGGPQAGIIAGKKETVEKLRKHPIYRALRADKLTIAFVEEVLSLYLSADPFKKIPALALASASADAIKTRIEAFVKANASALSGLKLSIEPSQAAMGGGTVPGKTLPSFALVIDGAGSKKTTAKALSDQLRRFDPPIIGIIQNERLMIDFRSVFEDDEKYLLKALKTISDSLF
ncbi:MAG: L-seryl-tRNA(Sec) selenium transferase [Candidatus Melainabacteria bacterium]|nr:L-seryl-tRNA(Sec) selenium transferase [Candidatus Melainabacteria bacterium]